MQNDAFNVKQIKAGYFTLQDMKTVVFECNSKARELHVTIGWSVRGHNVRASIKKKGVLLWQNQFAGPYFPENLCMMYEATRQKLTEMMEAQIAIDRAAQKEAKEREEERRIASMPTWGDKIKNQD